MNNLIINHLTVNIRNEGGCNDLFTATVAVRQSKGSDFNIYSNGSYY